MTDPLLTIPKSTAQAVLDAIFETKAGKAGYLLGTTLQEKPRTENEILQEHQVEKLNG
jgi:hypothetical protein